MAAECDLLSEIEVLQSIYLDELDVDRREDGAWEVSLVLHPSTAEDSVSQFVRLTLTLTLDQQYPLTSPNISIHNPRGLSDDKLSSVQKCLQLEAQSCLGSPVLYQLIEKAKEILTESNIPHGSCAICLYDFQEGEAFTKTSCYHYFHCHCLGRYVSHSESELRRREKELEEDKTRTRVDGQELRVVCPVCREPLTYDVDWLLSAPAPQLPETCALRWTRRRSAPASGRGGVSSSSCWRGRGLTAESSTRRWSPTASSSTSTRLLLKTGAQMLTGRPPPPGPRMLLASEWSSLPRDWPTAEAARPTGTTGEEAGPGRSTGEAPPSQRTCTSCVWRHTPPTNQRRPKLRVATPSRRRQMPGSVRQSQTGVFLPSGGSFQQRCLQTVRPRQPPEVRVQEVLQTAAATGKGGGALTGRPPTAGLRGLPATGTPKLLETEDTAGKEAGTAGDTAGGSSTKWWTGSEGERRCYDKEPPEG